MVKMRGNSKTFGQKALFARAVTKYALDAFMFPRVIQLSARVLFGFVAWDGPMYVPFFRT
jgi:hypothetical protein